MSSQFAEQEDHIINDDLRNFFHGPMSFSRRDLVANIIQVHFTRNVRYTMVNFEKMSEMKMCGVDGLDSKFF